MMRNTKSNAHELDDSLGLLLLHWDCVCVFRYNAVHPKVEKKILDNLLKKGNGT